MERTKKKCILKISLAVFLLFTFFVSYPAQAQTYPDRPIEYIVLFAAGASTDISVRTICEIAAKELGQPFVVLNKPGGGGLLPLALWPRRDQTATRLGVFPQEPWKSSRT